MSSNVGINSSINMNSIAYEVQGKRLLTVKSSLEELRENIENY